MKRPVEHVKRLFQHEKTSWTCEKTISTYENIWIFSSSSSTAMTATVQTGWALRADSFLCRKLGCVVNGNWGKRFISHESLLAFAPTSSSSSSSSSCYLSRTLAVASCRVLFAVEDASPHVNGYLVLSRHVERLLRSLYDPCTSAFRIPSQHFHKISKEIIWKSEILT